MKNEVWRVLKEYRDIEVSNLGNVRERKHIRTYEDGYSEEVPCSPISLTEGGRGTKMVRIHGKQEFVHRLVAQTFLDNPDEYTLVCHINGDMSDNRVENLRWCSRADTRHIHVNKRVKEYGTAVGTRVKCKETGQVFASYKAGAMYFHMRYDTFVNHIHMDKPIKGFHFEETRQNPTVNQEEVQKGYSE